jgi:hypothetical protein
MKILRIPPTVSAATPKSCCEWRAVHIAPFLSGRFDFVFGDENQVLLAAPALQERLERLAHHRLARSSRHATEVGKLIQILLDEKLASRS